MPTRCQRQPACTTSTPSSISMPMPLESSPSPLPNPLNATGFCHGLMYLLTYVEIHTRAKKSRPMVTPHTGVKVAMTSKWQNPAQPLALSLLPLPLPRNHLPTPRCLHPPRHPPLLLRHHRPSQGGDDQPQELNHPNTQPCR